MKTIYKALVTAIAIAFGLVVLLGYFIDLGQFASLRFIFLNWAVIVSAVALLVGVTNLASVHWGKLKHRQPGSFYSLVLLLSLIATIAVTGYLGPTNQGSLRIFDAVVVPVESSLMALLAILLVYAAARLLRRRLNGFTVIFLLTVLIALSGTAPILGMEIAGLHGPDGIRSLLSSVMATAGARGILLGVALGTVATGLRVLMGADRPYGS